VTINSEKLICDLEFRSSKSDWNYESSGDVSREDNSQSGGEDELPPTNLRFRFRKEPCYLQ
jgi:hypothetical protein